MDSSHTIQKNLDAGANLSIGARPDGTSAAGSTWHMNGQLDELEVFSQELSSSEIQSIYNAGRLAMESTDTSAAVSATDFDTNGDLYYAAGTSVYKEGAAIFGGIGEFVPDDTVNLSANVNAITMNSDYLYVATDSGVEKIDKTNLTGGSVLTIDSSNTDSTTNIATDATYSNNKLIITFSD